MLPGGPLPACCWVVLMKVIVGCAHIAFPVGLPTLPLPYLPIPTRGDCEIDISRDAS